MLGSGKIRVFVRGKKFKSRIWVPAENGESSTARYSSEQENRQGEAGAR
jgi:hypothetical protein